MSIDLSSITKSQLDVIVPRLFKKLNGVKYTVATKNIDEIEKMKKKSLHLESGKPVVIKVKEGSFALPQNNDELRDAVKKIKERALLLHKEVSGQVKRKITVKIKALDIILAQLTSSPPREEKQNLRKRTSDQQTSSEAAAAAAATAASVESSSTLVNAGESATVKKQELPPRSPPDKRQKTERYEKVQEDFEVPLVDKIGLPFDVIRRQSPSKEPTEKEKKTGESLKSLGEYFDACQIKGDGHCLFRSFAMSLIISYMPDHLGDLKNKLDELLKLLTEGEKAASKEEINNMYLCLDTLKNLPIEKVMQNQNISNGFVKSLRLLASHQIEEKKIEVGDKTFNEQERIAYCQDMKDMQKASYGGERELFALSGLFGKIISVIDLDAMAGSGIKGYSFSVEKDKPLRQKGIEGSESDVFKSTDIFILKNGDHYNSLFKKQERKKDNRLEPPLKRTKTEYNFNNGFFSNVVQVLKTGGFQSILTGLKEKNKFAEDLESVLNKGLLDPSDKCLIHILESLKESGVNLEGRRQCDVAQVLNKMIELSCGFFLLESIRKVSLDAFYSKLKDIFAKLQYAVRPEICITVPSLERVKPFLENIHTIHIPQGVSQWNLQEAFVPVKFEKRMDFLVDEEKAHCTKAYVQMFLKDVPYEEQLCINNPKNLFIKLDRFVPGSMWTLGFGAYKQDCTVQVPYLLQLRGKEDALVNYQLKSVVIHEGGKTPHAGQYSTYTPDETSLNQEGIPLNWKNDTGESVFFSDIKEKIEKSGYLFSYELS